MVAEHEQILEKLEAISTTVAGLAESMAILLDALQAPPASPAPAPAKVKIASYAQMYGPIAAAPAVTAVAVSTPGVPPRHGLWRWFLRERV